MPPGFSFTRNRQEAIVRNESGKNIAWTLVRPARLTNGPLDPSAYRTGPGGHGINKRVSRANVAHCLLGQLDDAATYARAALHVGGK